MKEGLLKVAGAINTLNGEACAHIEMIDEHRGYVQVKTSSWINLEALGAGNGYGIHSDYAIITGYSWGIVINF
jgi:hypothetical protein